MEQNGSENLSRKIKSIKSARRQFGIARLKKVPFWGHYDPMRAEPNPSKTASQTVYFRRPLLVAACRRSRRCRSRTGIATGRASRARLTLHRRLLVMMMPHVMLLHRGRRFSRRSRSFSRRSCSCGRRCRSRSRRLLRLHRRNTQRAGEERRTQDCQSPLHTHFSFILWRPVAGRMFKGHCHCRAIKKCKPNRPNRAAFSKFD